MIRNRFLSQGGSEEVLFPKVCIPNSVHVLFETGLLIFIRVKLLYLIVIVQAHWPLFVFNPLLKICSQLGWLQAQKMRYFEQVTDDVSTLRYHRGSLSVNVSKSSRGLSSSLSFSAKISSGQKCSATTNPFEETQALGIMLGCDIYALLLYSHDHLEKVAKKFLQFFNLLLWGCGHLDFSWVMVTQWLASATFLATKQK